MQTLVLFNAALLVIVAVGKIQRLLKGSAAASTETKKYQYESPTVSLLFKYYLKPMYQWLAPKLFPDWMHANLVTMLGAVFGFTDFLLLGLNSEWFTKKEQVPQAAWILAGCSFWMYMICDNCDGVQARRLKVSSPIGELLDHTVDCICLSTSAQLCAFMYLGEGPEEKALMGFRIILTFQYCFYLTHVLSILSGQLLLGYDYFSVDEMFLIFGFVQVLEGMAPGLLSEARVSMAGYLPASLLNEQGLLHVPGFLIAVMAILPGIYTSLNTGSHLVGRLTTPSSNRITVDYALNKIICPFSLYALLAIYSSETYDAVWFFTITPHYGVVLMALVLERMHERGPFSPFFSLIVGLFIRFGLPHFGVAASVVDTLAIATAWLLFVTYIYRVCRQLQVEYAVKSILYVRPNQD